MAQFKRPSNKEIISKLKAAKKANENNKIETINPDSLACDFIELGLSYEEDRYEIFNDLLKNTKKDRNLFSIFN